MRTVSRFRHLTVLAACALIFVQAGLTACTRGEVELKNTVSAYTQMLAESLAKPDSGKMGFFASPEEINRIDSYILLMLKEKKVLISNLQKLDFRSVDRDKEKKTAAVTTYEEWTFHYVDEKSRKPISKEERIAYNNVYHLITDKGRWVVDRIDMNETQTAGTAVDGAPAASPAGSLPGTKQNAPQTGKF